MACCKDTACKAEQDYLVCTCMGIMYSELCQAINEGSKTFEELADIFMVGTGCSSCVPEIEQMLLERK